MMYFLQSSFDHVRHEHDNYNREELIANTAKIFGETISHRELKTRARLWYAADHLTNVNLLNRLSHSPYIEVRESVAANVHTSTETLETLQRSSYFKSKYTVIKDI